MSVSDKCLLSTAKKGFDFVGIKFDKKVQVIFPVGYCIPNDDATLKRDILLLIKSFSLTESDEKEQMYTGAEHLDHFKLPLNAYFWLISDYINNGLYGCRTKLSKQSLSGKIDWKKTIQRDKAIVSNGGFVYMDPFHEQSKNTETLITEIEKYCLNLANQFFSWLFGDLSVSKSVFSDLHIQYMLGVLKKEMMISFTDHKKTLIRNMAQILSGLDDEIIKSRIYSYGTYNYSSVWESMIKRIYNNVDLSDYNPSTKWNLIVPGEMPSNRDLRPDAIHHDKKRDKYYILDAKYYGGNTGEFDINLPKSSDIEKQITYAQELEFSRKIPAESVFNAMILPYNKLENTFSLNKDIEYIGYASASWASKKRSYESVEIVFADTAYIMRNWCAASKYDVASLLTIIEMNAGIKV